jgi:hypothetical protein
VLRDARCGRLRRWLSDASQDIVTDRPSVTNSSVVVPTGSLQMENGVNWTAHPGQGTLDGPNTRFRFGIGGCTEMLVDLPDYAGGLYGHGPNGFSDVAPAIKHQFGGLPDGTNLSATVGLGLPTGARAISGSGLNPYLQFPWTQDLGGGWTAGGMLSTTWITGEPQSTTVFQPSFLIDRQVTSTPTCSPNTSATIKRAAHRGSNSISAGPIA